jgi:SAM-dependent methyltransferase
MGKASRRKGTKREMKVDYGRPVRRFLDRAGICRTPPSPALWELLRARLPRPYVNRLDELMDAREAGDRSVDPYPIFWETPEAARLTYGWVAPMTEAWLSWVDQHVRLGGRVLDIGSGMGVHTCYYALNQPNSEVVGIERAEQGVLRSQELAEQLGLTNVRFVHADARALDTHMLGGPFDTVMASAFLVDAEPAEFGAEDPDPWSVTRSVEMLAAGAGLELVDRLAAMLAPGGTYAGLERTPGAPELARWLGAARSAGLTVDTASVTHLPVGRDERLPALRAVKTGDPQDPAELVVVARRLFADHFAEEDRLAADPPVERVWGRELHIEDDHGHGKTRLEVLKLTSGAVATWMATSRGFRQFTPQRSAEDAVRMADGWVSRASMMDPSVVKVIEVEAGPTGVDNDDGSLVP